MREFTDRVPGAKAFIGVELVTNLTDREGTLPAHHQVDVKLPHGKIMRIPLHWLQADEPASEVLGGMLDKPPRPKRVPTK